MHWFLISVDNPIVVFVDFERGKNLVSLLESSAEVMMKIVVGSVTTSPTTQPNGQFTANNTSVLFVSISFIVLIIISLAWLVFYYIQRCRYTNAKERLSVSIPGHMVIKLVMFNWTQLSMKFVMLAMPTIVGILAFINMIQLLSS